MYKFGFNKMYIKDFYLRLDGENYIDLYLHDIPFIS